MYLGKRGELVALVVIGVLILASGIFFVSQLNGGNGITGAAIGLVDEPVNSTIEVSPVIIINDTLENSSNENLNGIPLIANISLENNSIYLINDSNEVNASENTISLVINQTSNNISETLTEETEFNLTTFENNISIQADCGGATSCNCYDRVTSSITLSGDLGPCISTAALRIETNDSITIDCAGYSLSGYNISGWNGVFYDYDNFNADFDETIMTIKNCHLTGFDYGISIDPTDCSGCSDITWVFENNTFGGNKYDFYSSGGLGGGGAVIIRDNQFQNLTYSGVGNAIHMSSGGSNAEVYNNEFIGKSGTAYGLVLYSLGIDIYNNTFNDSSLSFDSKSSNNRLYNNIFIDSTLSGGNGLGVQFNITKDCGQDNIIGGRCSGGNYWGSTVSNDTDDDNLGDDAYKALAVSAYDYLPLMDHYPYLNATDFDTNNLTLYTNLTNLSFNRGYNHSTDQEVIFVSEVSGFLFSNLTKHLGLSTFFNESLNASELEIEYDENNTVVNASGVTGIKSTHNVYLKNYNYENGVVVCKDVEKLTDMDNPSYCQGGNRVAFTKNDVRDGTYKDGIKVTVEESHTQASGMFPLLYYHNFYETYKIENVSGTGVTFNNASNLTIWDVTDESMPYGDQEIHPGEQMTFFANYSDSGGDNLTGANCTIYYHDSESDTMIFNNTKLLYEANRTYSSGGYYNWNVTCQKERYDTLTTNDTVFSYKPICGQSLTRNITLVENLTSNGTCFSVILTDGININCSGYSITGNGSGIGIVYANADNALIEDCVISNFSSGMRIISHSTNITLLNNTLINNTQEDYSTSAGGISSSSAHHLNVINNTFQGNYYGITLSSSDNISVTGNILFNNTVGEILIYNIVSGNFTNNNMSTQNRGIVLDSSSESNLLLNNEITTNGNESIYDDTGGSYFNLLIYNNSYGQIIWNQTDLTSNISLVVDQTIFLENNTIGIVDNSEILQLNSSAKIEIRDLSFGVTPWLFKNDRRCDHTDACNISYSGGVLSANVSSFSNYTAGFLDCGQIVLTNVTLTENITATGDCITVGADNVVLDCAGFSITGDQGAGDNGIQVNDYDNLTIKNCIIKNFDRGISLVSGNYHNITNNTVYNHADYSIYLSNIFYSVINKNDLYNITDYRPVYIYSSNNNNFTNNLAHDNINDGFRIHDGDNNILENNSIYDNGRYGVWISGSSDNNQMLNNNITNISTKSIHDITTLEPVTYNLLRYNNSNAKITWNLTDLDANISLSIGETIFLESNNLGLIDDANTQNLNGSAEITFYGLTGSDHTLLKNGVRCDDSDSCNITTDGSTLIADVSSFSNYTTEQRLQCGDTITENTTLIENLTTTGDCITIGTNNIVLDCAGYSMTGDSGSGDYGIYASSKNNITVKNCYIKEFSHGIYFTGSTNSTLLNNTAIDNFGGITFRGGSNNNLTSNNLLNNEDTGIYFLIAADGNLLTSNYIYNNSAGISLGSGTHNLKNNNLTFNTKGLKVAASSSSFYNNSFTNNSLSISDESLSYYNSLTYNNSYGEISWNLTNLTTTGDLLLGTNLDIANNTIAFNSSVHTNLNTTATISFFGTNVTTLRSIVKTTDYETDRNNILTSQQSCLHNTCTLQSSAAGNIVFNVSSLSSYTASEDLYCGYINESINMTINLTPTSGCFTPTENSITLDFVGHSINYTGSSGSALGINVAVQGFTVRNGEINNFNTSASTAVYGYGSTGLEVYNMSFDNNYYGVNIDFVSSVNISNNVFNGTTAWALGLDSTINSNVLNNIFDSNGNGIYFYPSASTWNNVLTNNNFTGNTNSFMDDSDGNNTLLYSNQFGQINWTIPAMYSANDLALGTNLYIANNTLSFNSTAHPFLNGNATISFFGTNVSTLRSIIKTSNYETDRNNILTSQQSCLYDTCTLQSSASGNITFNVSSLSSYTASEDLYCGYVNSSANMTIDLTPTEDCFILLNNNTAFDCLGYSITGDLGNGDNGIAANSLSNVTLQNCNINNFDTGIYTTDTIGSTISNNTVAGSVDYGVSLRGGISNLVYDNNFTNNSIAGLIFWTDATNNIAENNSFSLNDYGVAIAQSYFNNVSNNIFDQDNYSLLLSADAENNTLTNNNLTNALTSSILDTSTGKNNTLVYSNNFGQVSWTQEDFSLANDLGINSGLGIANNSIALNSSLHPNLNSSAEVKFYGTNITQINRIYKWSDYSTNSTDINANGVDCLGDTCTLSLIESGNITFTTESFSSLSTFYDAGDQCGSISDSFTLSNNVSANGTCFYITGDDLTFDCAGYTIIGDGTGLSAGYGIYSEYRNNVTLQNCSIKDFYRAISLNYPTSFYLTNNTAYENIYGVVLTGSDLTNISQNNLGGGTQREGVMLYSSQNTTIENNNISTYLVFPSIRFYSGNDYNTINNNTLQGGGTGIYLDGSDSNIIQNNNITNTSWGGIVLGSFSYADTVENNTIRGNQSEGQIVISGFSGNHYFINNDLLGTGPIKIGDSTSSSYHSTLIYNNSFGGIYWDLENLTTAMNLSVGETIFLESNNVGLIDSADSQNLNGTATVKINGLSFATTPHLNKSGIGICDWNNTCNISSYEGGILTAVVSSFSNYTASNNTAPTFSANYFVGEPYYTNTSQIEARTQASDPESDPLTYNVSWIVDGVIVKNDSFSNSSGVEVTYYLLDSDFNYNKSNVIEVNVTVYDNLLLNANATTGQTTIGNIAPYIDPQLSTTTINTSEEWYYDANATDLDVNDSVDTLTWGDNTTLFVINTSTGEINYTPSEAEAGVYSIEINVTDGTATNTSSFFLTINDIEIPRVTIESPNGTYATNISLYLNYTAVDANRDACWYNLDNSTNTTLAGCTNTTFNTTYGSHVLYLYVNDTYGNLNSSSSSFNVTDSQNPSLTLEAPTATNYTTNESLDLNYTVSDVNLDSCWYNIDGGTNTTISNCLNTTFNTSSGSQTLYIYANDTSGNLNSTNVTFTVDLTPVISSLSLSPDPAYTNDTLNASVLFSGDGITTEYVYFNWTVDGVQVNFSTVAASDGTISNTLASTYYNKTHNVTAFVWGGDALSNSSILSTSINISNAPPILLQSFNDTSGTTGDSFTYNLTLYFNDTDLDDLNYTSTSGLFSVNDTTNIATIVSGTAGTYEIYINATDGTNSTLGNGFNITWTDAVVPTTGPGGGTPSYTCTSDDDCDPTVENYCSSGRVFSNTTNYICENPRTTRSECVADSYDSEYVETCPYGCSAGSCVLQGQKSSGGISCPPGKVLVEGECVEILGDPEEKNYNDLAELFDVVYPTSYTQKIPEDSKSCLKGKLNPILKLTDRTYDQAMDIFNSANGEVSVIHELNGNHLKLLWIVKEATQNTYCTELDIYPVKEDRNNDYFWSIGNVLTEGTSLASEYICFKTEGVPTLITQDFILCEEIMERDFEIKEVIDSLN
jgi:parallel beta-helix repeat protein